MIFELFLTLNFHPPKKVVSTERYPSKDSISALKCQQFCLPRLEDSQNPAFHLRRGSDGSAVIVEGNVIEHNYS